MAWAPDYCTAAELKAFVRIADTADDVQVALAITAASRAIDKTCNRQFGLVAAAEARYYTARWNLRRLRWVIEIDDLMTTTNLAVTFDEANDETYTATISDYVLRPKNATATSRPWTELVVHPNSDTFPNKLEDGVKVTAIFGWTTVPTPIKQATLLQASRILARRDSPYGVAGSPEAGSEMRLLAKLDPDVAVVVAPYRRWWGSV